MFCSALLARQPTAVLAPAYLAGILVGDRAFARPFNLTQSQATVLNIGAGAGALVGLAVPALTSTGGGVAAGAAALGATLGMMAIASTFPSRSEMRVGARNLPRRTAGDLSVSGAAAAAALAGVPGRHVLAIVRF